jgi:hypothetical protein
MTYGLLAALRLGRGQASGVHDGQMPLFAFEGRQPDVSPAAWIAPTATLGAREWPTGGSAGYHRPDALAASGRCEPASRP